MSDNFDKIKNIMNEKNDIEVKQESKIKKILFNLLFGIFYIISFVILLVFVLLAIKKIETDFIYSIPKPDIYGYFKKEIYGVNAFGLKVYTKEETASLSIVDFDCSYSTKTCTESTTTTINLNGVFMHSYRAEYEIKFKDKNKIYFSGNLPNVSGEVNLLTDEVIFYYKNEQNETSQLKIITEKSEIDKYMKNIIRKSLRNKLF